ncbi:MAG: extracellular solute-binding protein [Xanthobacteraceae bacterium]
MSETGVKVMSSGGLKAVITQLADAFTRASGRKLVPTFGPPAAIKVRIESGEAVDVAVLAAPLIDALVSQGKLAEATELARSGLGIAVRAGAPKPDIASVEAFRRTLLAAKSIVAGDPAAGGASGIHFAKVIEQLGIADAVMAKTRLNSGSYNAEFVARGEAELAIQQISEILPVKGAELVGPLPPGVQATTVFKAAIGTNAPEPAAAKELIAFLRTPQGAQVIAATGMEPA